MILKHWAFFHTRLHFFFLIWYFTVLLALQRDKSILAVLDATNNFLQPAGEVLRLPNSIQMSTNFYFWRQAISRWFHFAKVQIILHETSLFGCFYYVASWRSRSAREKNHDTLRVRLRLRPNQCAPFWVYVKFEKNLTKIYVNRNGGEIFRESVIPRTVWPYGVFTRVQC